MQKPARQMTGQSQGRADLKPVAAFEVRYRRDDGKVVEPFDSEQDAKRRLIELKPRYGDDVVAINMAARKPL